MDALFSQSVHKVVWGQLTGKPFVMERRDSISDEKQNIQQVEKN